jgi:hypothetical protein
MLKFSGKLDCTRINGFCRSRVMHILLILTLLDAISSGAAAQSSGAPLFRACSRVVFTASTPKTEMISKVHPGFAVVGMGQGCISDPMLRTTSDDRPASENFAAA